MKKITQYETVIASKAKKIAKDLPKNERAEGEQILRTLLEEARDIAFVKGHEHCQVKDGSVWKLNSAFYRGNLDKYIEQIERYVQATKNDNNPLEPLRCLVNRRMVLGTGDFGFKILTKDFQGCSDKNKLEEKLAEVVRKSENEISYRYNLAEKIGCNVESQREWEEANVRPGFYSRPQHPSTDSV